MKTLYISDLDGTLLNRDAALSDYTIDALNRLIAGGLNFSVATARTAATCDRMLEKLHLNVPIILMNGVLIYDYQKKQYIKKELLTSKKVSQIIRAMRKTNLTGLMYGLCDDKLVTYYESVCNESMKSFMGERVLKYNKKFTRLKDFSSADIDIIYFCYIDHREHIHRLYDEIKDVEGLRIERYRDIYSDDDVWYMEVFAGTASKYNAVMFLRRQYRYDRVVSFGDNLNDLPLFLASDMCYAVANAKDEVKARANAVIGANTEDGVVKWLEGTICRDDNPTPPQPPNREKRA